MVRVLPGRRTGLGTMDVIAQYASTKGRSMINIMPPGAAQDGDDEEHIVRGLD